MKKRLLFLLSIGFLFSFISQIDAQKKRKNYIPDSERFSAGIVFGYNAAQIDGDFFTGFDKFGITGGIRGIARFTPRLDFNVEMLYSKKGSKIANSRLSSSVRQEKNRIIDLTYMDAPFFFKWLLEEQQSSWHIEVGAIYSRLINTKITEKITNSTREFVYQEVVADFKKDDVSFLAGIGHTWKNGIALNFRYSIGFNKFYVNKNYERSIPGSLIAEPVSFLRNYYYNINLSYTLFKRNKK